MASLKSHSTPISLNHGKFVKLGLYKLLCIKIKKKSAWIVWFWMTIIHMKRLFLSHDLYKNKENITQLKKQLQNVEEALEATRHSSKNEEHKSNQLLAEKVQYMLYQLSCPLL